MESDDEVQLTHAHPEDTHFYLLLSVFTFIEHDKFFYVKVFVKRVVVGRGVILPIERYIPFAPPKETQRQGMRGYPTVRDI